jgi:hypothetical protein
MPGQQFCTKEPCAINALYPPPGCLMCRSGWTLVRGKCVVVPEPIGCGGKVNRKCPDGLKCVDDPSDKCHPDCGDKNCRGICIRPAAAVCGGIQGLPCKRGYQCFDREDDSCNKLCGGADCIGDCGKVVPYCPGGKVWTDCPRVCDITCKNPDDRCIRKCSNVPKCQCPPGKPIWDIRVRRCVAKNDCTPIIPPCGKDPIRKFSCIPRPRCHEICSNGKLLKECPLCGPTGPTPPREPCCGACYCPPYKPVYDTNKKICITESQCGNDIADRICGIGCLDYRTTCGNTCDCTHKPPTCTKKECEPNARYLAPACTLCDSGFTLYKGECIPIPPIPCGGIAVKPCPASLTCVDDPSDKCHPDCGHKDCRRICMRVGPTCGGILGSPCKKGYKCFDKEGDGCNPLCGGADCIGECGRVVLPYCKGGKVWEICGRGTCIPTCEAPFKRCPHMCIDGCYCPPSKPIWDEDNKICTELKRCPSRLIDSP